MPAPAFHCFDDTRAAARRRLPRMIFDYIDGAAGGESAARRNRRLLDDVRLQPRALVDVENRSLKKSFLGRCWGLPFGIAPMGMCALAGPGADGLLADAAVRHDIPLGLSTMASSTIEAIRERAGDNAWFQLYVSGPEQQALDLVRRAERAGYPVLILTVDVPQVAPRPRDLRNGFQAPLRIGPKQFVDFALHPRWSLGTLRAGVPRVANFPAGTFRRGASRGAVDGDFLHRLRALWPRTLIVKGIMAPADALAVRAAGADAVYVSNHGGRQLDSAPAAAEQLPLIRAALGDDFPLLFDSGVRGGEGVIKALALGADFVMLGRPFLYAIGAGGGAGLERWIELLGNEISVALAQIGRPDIERVDRGVLAGGRAGGGEE